MRACYFLFLLLVVLSCSCLSKTVAPLLSPKLKKISNLIVHAHRLTKSNEFYKAVTYYEGAIQLLEGLPQQKFSKLRVQCTLKLARCLLKSKVHKKAIARCSEAIDECSNILLTTPKHDLKGKELKTIADSFAAALCLRSIAKMKLGGENNEKSAAVDFANSLTCSNTDFTSLSTADMSQLGYNPLTSVEDDETFFEETQRKRYSEHDLAVLASPHPPASQALTQPTKPSSPFSLRKIVEMGSKVIGKENPLMRKLLQLVDSWEHVQHLRTVYGKVFGNSFDVIALTATVVWLVALCLWK